MKRLTLVLLGTVAVLPTVTGADNNGVPRIALKGDASTLVGKPAPDIVGRHCVNGKVRKLSALKGRPVLVNFWAVRCPACQNNFECMRELNKEFGPNGLVVLGVTRYHERYGFNKKTGKVFAVGKAHENGAWKDGLTAVQENIMLKDFAAHHKLEYPLLIMGQEPWKSLSSGPYHVVGIPAMYLIDREGVVRAVRIGTGTGTSEFLRQEIKKLLSEQ